jgi:hypothetical protein
MVLVGGGSRRICEHHPPQTIVDDRLRGRVAGFFMMAFLGVAPVAPLPGRWPRRWRAGNVSRQRCAVRARGAVVWRSLPTMAGLLRPTYKRLGIITD